ncbi:putative bifunctional diguanylate cyclase/phosphodiesterase [Marinobacter sp. SS21]|uniref:putative bifunctional diguanylate cyclase/phosphodiesterase n=1 Tax=Marinobacter sp. SS21 TaxID=2979460 RepID=UPI002330050E|nr:EAL domain-containing protein [Marinobacter sp. SS21]MDC0661567.1 EAL domain-containing protein [Marinobacter sp. SS21]
MLGLSVSSKKQWKIVSLIAGLLGLVLAAVIFTVAVVQIQAAVVACVAGNGIWSRAQLASVHYLAEYAESGNPNDLKLARRWLDIPHSIFLARRELDGPRPDMEYTRAALVRANIHPDDVSRLVWLYQYFSAYPDFNRAIQEWVSSDDDILALVAIANRLEYEWGQATPSEAVLVQAQQDIGQRAASLEVVALEFRLAIGRAARNATVLMSVVSLIFLALLALGAWRLTRRLVQILRRSEQKFRAIFEQSAVGILQLDDQGQLLDANEACCQILGYDKKQLTSAHYSNLMHPEDWALNPNVRDRLIAGNRESRTQEQRMLKGSGDVMWARLTSSIMQEGSGRKPYFIVMLEDISESHRLSKELSHQATHDPLTDLLNRRAFEHRLASTLGRARNDNTSHALCFVDLDGFKQVNDASGHGAGDQLLRLVSGTIRADIREGDILARLGGDEFGVILENCDLRTAATIAEKLRTSIEELTFVWEGRTHHIGCSIGVVRIHEQAPDISALMRTADMACYTAKDQGRNRVCVSTPEAASPSPKRTHHTWLSDTQELLDANRLILNAQRVTSTLGTNTELRYEILLRMLDDNGELIAAAEFLPAAMRFGVMHELDRWVIRTVLERLTSAPQHLTMLTACHINLASPSFDQPDFAAYVVSLIQKTGFPGHKLCFEITEETTVHHLVDVQNFMDQLSPLGCRFVLDNFGSSLTSFSYLRGLPVDKLKIDGAYMKGLLNGGTELAMVRAIHDICRSLGIQTICSFVESEQIADTLQKLGIDYLQGSAIHHPCHLDQVLNGEAQQPLR